MLAIKEESIGLIIAYLQHPRKPKAVLIKTDTVWGLLSFNAQLLYDMKKRPLKKPLVRLVFSNDTIHNLNDDHKKFLARFWPGAVTVIKNGISYRMPNDYIILSMLRMLGDSRPVFCTSANISGGDPIENYDEAVTIFNEWARYLAFIIPKKKKEDRPMIPSTIIDLDTWRIVRKGVNYREITLWIYKNIVNKKEARIISYTRELSEEYIEEVLSNWISDPTYTGHKRIEKKEVINSLEEVNVGVERSKFLRKTNKIDLSSSQPKITVKKQSNILDKINKFGKSVKLWK